MGLSEEYRRVLRELLTGVADGVLAYSTADLLLGELLRRSCPVCRSRLPRERLPQRRRELAQVPYELLPDMQRDAAEEQRSRRELARLFSIKAPAAQLARVTRANARFTSPRTAALLIGRVLRALDQPEEAHHLAKLAEAVAARAGRFELAALAVGLQANALRAGGRLREAGPLFDTAWSRLPPLAPPFILAELQSLEGSLRKDQRRFPEAERLLHRALETYRQLRQPLSEARTLLQLAEVQWTLADPSAALDTVQRALPLVRDSGTPRLFLWAHHNLVLYLDDVGEKQLAQIILDLTRPLYQQFPDRLPQLRLRWLEGHLAANRRDHAAAEVALREVVDRLTAASYPLLAAIASIELCELLLETGQYSELREFSALLVPILAAEGIERESQAAVLMLHRAALAGTVSSELLRELRHRLESTSSHLS